MGHVGMHSVTPRQDTVSFWQAGLVDRKKIVYEKIATNGMVFKFRMAESICIQSSLSVKIFLDEDRKHNKYTLIGNR